MRRPQFVMRHPLLVLSTAMAAAALVTALGALLGLRAAVVAAAPLAGGAFFGWLGSRGRNASTAGLRSLFVLLAIFGAFLTVMVVGMLVTASSGNARP